MSVRRKSAGGLLLGLILAALAIQLLAGPAASAWQAGEARYFPLVLQGWPTASATPSPGRLLITEVLSDPALKEPDAEWIEVANVGDLPLALVDYKIGDEESLGGPEGMYLFPVSATLQAGQAAVIAVRGVSFESAYGRLPDYELVETHPLVPTMVKHSAWAGGSVSLENAGDEVLLLGRRDAPVDAVSWGSSEFAFSPPAPRAAEGYSLERYPANLDHDAASDWAVCDQPQPGAITTAEPTPTPGPTLASPTPSPSPTPALPQGWVLNELQADPDAAEGDANGDGKPDPEQDEFVEIANLTEAAVDLSGWRLYDGLMARHTFPEGSWLAHGCTLLVFGGGMPVGAFGGSLVQTASSGRLGLDNYGDYVRLYDQHGYLVLDFEYGQEASQNQAVTRSPDLTGGEPLTPHSEAAGAAGRLFSPGVQVDGAAFLGCPPVP